jgi:hypothetical protein
MCNPRQLKRTVFPALLLLWSSAGLIDRNPASAQDTEGIQVQTRGPVHEAFAELVATEPQPGIIVPKSPPPPVEELPPEEAPAGDNVVWIPGYWGWDEEREDFLWVSGIWRITPPDCGWVPGYWSQVDGGFQWVAGYWLPNEVEEVEYLPQPPESIEEGPSNDSPSPNSIWLNGTWIWSDDRYMWRSGYWVDGRPDWVYISPHYIWTPRGCVCVEGYWDHPLAYRGVLFAPVYFTRPVYAERGYHYSPNIFIDVTILTSQLFRHPRYDHYVFGDYYDDHYSHHGIVPWFEPCHGRHGYDPIFAQERWARRRDDPEWMEHLRHDHESRKKRPEARPPKVFDPHAAIQVQADPEQRILLAKPLQEAGSDKNLPLKLVKIDPDRREHFGQTRNDLQRFSEARIKLETAPPSPATSPGQEFRSKKVAIAKSPIRSRVVPTKTGADAPPALPKAPTPDPHAQLSTPTGSSGQTGGDKGAIMEPPRREARPNPPTEQEGKRTDSIQRDELKAIPNVKSPASPTTTGNPGGGEKTRSPGPSVSKPPGDKVSPESGLKIRGQGKEPSIKSFQSHRQKQTSKPPQDFLNNTSPNPLPESKRPVPKVEANNLESKARNLGISDVPKLPIVTPGEVNSKQLRQGPSPTSKRNRSHPVPGKATPIQSKTIPKENQSQKPPLSLRSPVNSQRDVTKPIPKPKGRPVAPQQVSPPPVTQPPAPPPHSKGPTGKGKRR